MRRVLVFDTTVVCVWLKVPGKETCGREGDRWDHERVEQVIAAESKQGSTFVLPIATIIETGNHISQAAVNRYNLAQGLMKIVEKTLSEEEPWAAFSRAQTASEEMWRRTVAEWPKLAVAGLSLGDATIKLVAEEYAQSGYEVVIATGDEGLEAYSPEKAVPVPRRRR